MGFFCSLSTILLCFRHIALETKLRGQTCFSPTIQHRPTASASKSNTRVALGCCPVASSSRRSQKWRSEYHFGPRSRHRRRRRRPRKTLNFYNIISTNILIFLFHLPCFWDVVGYGDGGDGVEQTVECRSAAAMAKTTTDLICCVFGETNSRRRVHFTRFRRRRSHRHWRRRRQCFASSVDTLYRLTESIFIRYVSNFLLLFAAICGWSLLDFCLLYFYSSVECYAGPIMLSEMEHSIVHVYRLVWIIRRWMLSKISRRHEKLSNLKCFIIFSILSERYVWVQPLNYFPSIAYQF